MTVLLEPRSSLRNWISIAAATVRLGAGFVAYGVSGKSPAFAYQSLVRLFTLTSGRSNDLLAKVIGWFRRPYPLVNLEGVLGFRGQMDLERIAAHIAERGYFVFDRQLPEDICNQLTQFALTQPCRPRVLDAGPTETDSRALPYPRDNPGAIIYDFAPGDLINAPVVQSLMADSSISALAEFYLGAKPVLDTVNMWWTTAFSQQPDRNAAQLYHFDMNHVRWLKFFIYLTDMTPEAGPHCFVAGTHRAGAIPSKFLSQGYARMSDEDIRACYPACDVIEFIGKRCTIIAEDTRGLHKGKPVVRGDRLMFEFEFSNCLFGANLSKNGKIAVIHDPALKTFARKYPRIFSRWIGDQTQL